MANHACGTLVYDASQAIKNIDEWGRALAGEASSIEIKCLSKNAPEHIQTFRMTLPRGGRANRFQVMKRMQQAVLLSLILHHLSRQTPVGLASGEAAAPTDEPA